MVDFWFESMCSIPNADQLLEAESEESDERVIGRKTSEMEKNEARRVELCKR